MIEGSNASALLGLHGMVMTGIEVADEVTITVETTADRVGCRGCGVIASLHDRRRVRVRDLEIAGRPTVLIWNKRIWRCREAQCSTCTWTELHDAIAPRASLTERAGAEICRRVGQDSDSVAKTWAEASTGSTVAGSDATLPAGHTDRAVPHPAASIVAFRYGGAEWAR